MKFNSFYQIIEQYFYDVSARIKLLAKKEKQLINKLLNLVCAITDCKRTFILLNRH